MRWNLLVNLHQPSPTLSVWFGQTLIICSLTGICVMLSFLASYCMYIWLMVLVLVHSCAKPSKRWDTKLRWLPNKVVGIRTLFWGRCLR